jgi:hypothetical protein
MSFTVIVAICILGCDVAIYVFFKRMYGEEHRRHVRRPPREGRDIRSTKTIACLLNRV